jgi:peroxiredoxin
VKKRVVFGAIAAIVVVVGLFFVNRYWIAPVTVNGAKGMEDHPAAPEFTLTDLSGQTLKLSNYRGKVVLLDFWATWCGPCRMEIPGFVELQNKYRDQGFQVIGVSMDDGPEPVRDFYKEFKMNYPVAMGDDKLGELYGGVLGLPTSFVIGRDGRIYAKHVGASDISVFEEEIKTLLQAQGTASVSGFHQAGYVHSADAITLGDPTLINSEVPGVDLRGLTAAEKTAYEATLQKRHCTCGCNMTILECRHKDRACGVSLAAAKEELEKIKKSRT